MLKELHVFAGDLYLGNEWNGIRMLFGLNCKIKQRCNKILASWESKLHLKGDMINLAPRGLQLPETEECQDGECWVENRGAEYITRWSILAKKWWQRLNSVNPGGGEPIVVEEHLWGVLEGKMKSESSDPDRGAPKAIEKYQSWGRSIHKGHE